MIPITNLTKMSDYIDRYFKRYYAQVQNERGLNFD